MADDRIARALPDISRDAAILVQHAEELTDRSAEVTERARLLREHSSAILQRNQTRRATRPSREAVDGIDVTRGPYPTAR